MTKTEIEIQFKKNEPMLHKLAHQCASRCGRPEDEVYQQACYEFMQATETYHLEKGFTYSYWSACVRNNLIQWGMKNPLVVCDPEGLLVDVPDSAFAQPDEQVMRREWIDNLSDECREIAMIVLNGPSEVLHLTQDSGRKAVLGALSRYLRGEKGWTWPKIWKTIQDMKQACAIL